MPDPDKIPNMSLDNDRDHERPRATSPAPSSGYQPVAEVPKSSSASTPPPTCWSVGDDVLAPWEPSRLYAGTIKEIKIDDARGDQALIDFDDGGEGWVFLYSLCPLQYQRGQKVECRRNNGPHYEPATVMEAADSEVRVRFDAGGEEWTTMATLRVPCIENGPAAVPTKFAPFQAAPASPSSGVSSWLMWAGLAVLLALARFACEVAHD